VNKNFSLTIAPGATVDFNNNNGNIMVDGTLKAVGTKTARIQFVKQNTDVSWGGTVSFNSSGKNSKLSFVNIDKLGSTASPALGTAVAVNTNAVAIDNIVVSNSQNTGMMINKVNPLIVQSSFLANKDGVLSTGGKANFVQCTFQGNTGYGIKNVSTKGTDKIDARYCWWGTAKGPRIATNPGGNGDSVSTKVLYSPFQAVKNELYLPVLDSTRLSDSLACPGSNIIVSVKATGVFGEGNVFTAELSNASGDFTNPVTIGSVTESLTGNLAAVDVNAVLPASVKGKNYKIRLTSSAPAAVSDAVSIIPTNCNGIASENISSVSKLPDAGFKIIAYPNPTANTARLTIDGVRGKTAMISISDLSGRMLWQGKAVAGDRVSLPVERYATGTYIITVVCDNETKVVKLVKN